jgi:predicted nucleic acid-binding protein
MPMTSNFNFTNNSVVTLELPFSEHVEELRQRFFFNHWDNLIVYMFCICGSKKSS